MNSSILMKWNELSTQLHSFVSHKIGSKEAAKDIVQDVFIRVQSNINDLKDASKVNSWIFQITRNLINDYYRNQKLSDTSSSELVSKSQDFSKDETMELAKCMMPMIDLLPEKYRTAIILVEIEGLSQTELADKLQISYSGAKSRVQRGREKLKALYLQCCMITTDNYGNVIEYNNNTCSTDCK